MFFKKTPREKADKLEKKGDHFLDKHQYEKALKAYRDASELNPESPSLYEKLVNAQSRLEGDWNENDFIENISWVMKKQEIDTPEIKNLHETLNPEYAQIKKLIAHLLSAPPEEKAADIERIKAYGEKAVLPLLHTLITLDQLARDASLNSEEEKTFPGDDVEGGC